MQWHVLRNSILFFLLFITLFFLAAFGILYFCPDNFVLDVSLWWQILLPCVCFLLHIYIGLFTGKKCLLYSNLFNGIIWGLWLFLLIWFLPVLLNIYTVCLPLAALVILGFFGAMLGKSLALVIDGEKNPPQA